jgi:uncharacterized protein (TIGR00251 family)
MWYEIKDGYVTFNIKVQPNSSKNSFSQVLHDGLKINIKAPPVEGEANEELIEFLSKSFKTPKSSIEIKSGKKSKRKSVRLPLNDRINEFINSLITHAHTRHLGFLS